jgi:hypothetical protein
VAWDWRAVVLEYMSVEGVLFDGVGEHTTPLEVVGGGKLEGDCYAWQHGRERLESCLAVATRSSVKRPCCAMGEDLNPI